MKATTIIESDRRKVTICSACLRASCWHGEFYCDQAKTAGTHQRTVGELRALGLEHPHHYSVRKVREVCGAEAVAGYEQFEGLDEADEPCWGCGKPWSQHATSRAPDAPVPRMPCIGLKSGYQPRRVR